MPRAAKVSAFAIECTCGYRSEGYRRTLPLLHLCPDAELLDDQAMTHVFGLNDDIHRLPFFYGDFARFKSEAAGPNRNRLGIVAGLGGVGRACRRVACEYCKRNGDKRKSSKFHRQGPMVDLESRSRCKKFQNQLLVLRAQHCPHTHMLQDSLYFPWRDCLRGIVATTTIGLKPALALFCLLRGGAGYSG